MDDAALTLRLLEYLARLPGWEWRPNGPAYTVAEIGLFYGPIGTDPDRAVGVRVYADGTSTDAAQRRVQLRLRGARRDVTAADAMAGVAFTALDGLSRVTGILSAQRIAFALLGADSNGREERTETYLITLDNVEALQS